MAFVSCGDTRGGQEVSLNRQQLGHQFLWLFRFNDRWFGAFLEGVDFLSGFGLAVIALRAAGGACNGDGVAL